MAYIEDSLDGEIWLAERGPLSLEQALSVGRQLGEALHAAHSEGICHHDLKPANLLLSDDPAAAGGVKAHIIDFGLSTQVVALQQRIGRQSMKTMPVNTFSANPWGLYDMHGNVWEWTGAAYAEGFGGPEQRWLSRDADAAVRRVLRGGSWNNKTEEAAFCVPH